MTPDHSERRVGPEEEGGGGRMKEEGGGCRYLCSDLILRPVTANKLTDRRFSLKPGPADPQPPLAPTQHSAEREL